MVRSCSPTSSSINDIEDLSAALHQLRLAQERVNRVLSRLQASSPIPVAVPVRDRSTATVSPPRPPLRRVSNRFGLGDRVRINRPGRNQESSGVIVGVTSSGFLQIRTPNNSIILRQPHNVTLLDQS